MAEADPDQTMGTHAARLGPAVLRLLISVVFAVVIAMSPVSAGAQENRGSIYAIGGVTVPHQQGVTGEEPQTYVAAPGGTSWSWLLGGGVFVTRRLSVEGELSPTGIMTAREPSRYNQTYNEERRDWFLAGNLRFHLRPGSRADVEPIAGALVTRHEGWSQVEYVSYTATPPQRTVFPRVAVILPTTLGLNTGVDVRLGGRHLAIVPSVRFRWRFAVFGDNKSFSWYPAGFPHWTVSPGVLVRVDF